MHGATASWKVAGLQPTRDRIARLSDDKHIASRTESWVVVVHNFFPIHSISLTGSPSQSQASGWMLAKGIKKRSFAPYQ